MSQTMTREQILASIVPKSDQLNAEDLMSAPRTVTVAGVSAGAPDQPVNIRLENEPRFYRPCKTMRRLLIFLWGDDGHAWIGRSMTLVYDPNVMFGGVKVGGIRISHLSHIPNKPVEIALTVTRGKRAPYRVQPLVTHQPPGGGSPQPPPTAGDAGAGAATAAPATPSESAPTPPAPQGAGSPETGVEDIPKSLRRSPGDFSYVDPKTGEAHEFKRTNAGAVDWANGLGKALHHLSHAGRIEDFCTLWGEHADTARTIADKTTNATAQGALHALIDFADAVIEDAKHGDVLGSG